jgi:cupin 2 domain-containing protein
MDELCQAKAFRVDRIVSAGQMSPPGFWYDQVFDEWVLILQGRAEVRLLEPEETIQLSAGDWLMIDAHRRHRVEATSRARHGLSRAWHLGYPARATISHYGVGFGSTSVPMFKNGTIWLPFTRGRTPSHLSTARNESARDFA